MENMIGYGSAYTALSRARCAENITIYLKYGSSTSFKNIVKKIDLTTHYDEEGGYYDEDMYDDDDEDDHEMNFNQYIGEES